MSRLELKIEGWTSSHGYESERLFRQLFSEHAFKIQELVRESCEHRQSNAENLEDVVIPNLSSEIEESLDLGFRTCALAWKRIIIDELDKFKVSTHTQLRSDLASWTSGVLESLKKMEPAVKRLNETQFLCSLDEC